METDPEKSNLPRPLLDPSLLPPLLIGTLSLLGICAILISTRLPEQNTVASPTASATPFQYVFLGTETISPTLEDDQEMMATPEVFLAPQPEGDTVPPPTVAEGNETVTADPALPTATITPDPIFAEAEPLEPGTYDDVDPQIILMGTWNIESHPDAYQESLLVSNIVGNYAAFRFVGSQMILGFQDGPDAGSLKISIDGVEESLLQTIGTEWGSPELSSGVHYVILTHESGVYVNLDYIDIFE